MLKEQCYGIVIVYKEQNENFFLLLQQYNKLFSKGSWSFPKGHHEGTEKPKDTALRELEEETGITEVEFVDFPLIYEEYCIERKGEKILKINEYFIGFVKDKKVTPQEGEIIDYKWLSYEEAMDTFVFKKEDRQKVLKQAKECLDMLN